MACTRKKYNSIFANELVLLPRTVLRLSAAYENQNRIILDRIYYLNKKNDAIHPKYLLALLNSRLISFWFEENYSSTKLDACTYRRSSPITVFYVSKNDRFLRHRIR